MLCDRTSGLYRGCCVTWRQDYRGCSMTWHQDHTGDALLHDVKTIQGTLCDMTSRLYRGCSMTRNQDHTGDALWHDVKTIQGMLHDMTSRPCRGRSTKWHCCHTALTSFYAFRHLVQLLPQKIDHCPLLFFGANGIGVSVFMAQNSWQSWTAKVTPAAQWWERSRPDVSCVSSCPTSSIANCKTCTYIADNF